MRRFSRIDGKLAWFAGIHKRATAPDIGQVQSLKLLGESADKEALRLSGVLTTEFMKSIGKEAGKLFVDAIRIYGSIWFLTEQIGNLARLLVRLLHH